MGGGGGGERGRSCVGYTSAQRLVKSCWKLYNRGNYIIIFLLINLI